MDRGCIDHSSPAKTLHRPDNFSALHFQVPGSTQEFPAQTTASMMNTGDQWEGTDRLLVGWTGQREREGQAESVCACWRMQEPAPGVCAGGSILSVCAEKGEDFNILVFKPFPPCLVIIRCDYKPKLTSRAHAGQVISVHKRRLIHTAGNGPPAGCLLSLSASLV